MRKPAGAAAPLIWVQPPPPPRQRSLGREEIVAAAIALADEAGPDALTMKAVAARLGPYTAMALYRYVYSKDGLVDLMLDAATAEIPLPAQPGPDWRADLLELAAQTRQMIKRHPWYAGAVPHPPAGRAAHDAAAGVHAAGADRAGREHGRGDDLRRPHRPAHLRQRAAGSGGGPDEPAARAGRRRPAWRPRWRPSTTWPPPAAGTRS